MFHLRTQATSCHAQAIPFSLLHFHFLTKPGSNFSFLPPSESLNPTRLCWCNLLAQKKGQQNNMPLFLMVSTPSSAQKISLKQNKNKNKKLVALSVFVSVGGRYPCFFPPPVIVHLGSNLALFKS
jgi:hypothetical protein